MLSAVFTTRQCRYRMPAEWEPHAATWLSWPRRECVSFRANLNDVLVTFAAIARVLGAHEPVCINVADAAMEAEARAAIGSAVNVHFHHIPTNEPWCRDHGPTFVVPDSKHENPPAGIAVVDWDYNAYGGKFRPFDRDDAVPQRIAEILGLTCFRPGMVLEGGSIDVNGMGAVLVTESCLLHPNRNPQLTRAQIEQSLRDYLDVTDVLWLGRGLVGDDTDGHVDDLARFVSPTSVVTVVEDDPHDANYAALQDNRQRLQAMEPVKHIVELPMPGAVTWRGDRQPASYANFYIANGVVLVPTFQQAHDTQALEILQELFPTREVVGLDSRAVICGGGSFHCLTQQQPAG